MIYRAKRPKCHLCNSYYSVETDAEIKLMQLSCFHSGFFFLYIVFFFKLYQ